MARPWRIDFEGAYYHILSRGNERREIFYDDTDRGSFLDVLGEMSERFNVEIFAFVLMPNHYHLLLRTLEANLSRAMQWFGVTYTRRFNNRHDRCGHLFQGRFRSLLVENDAYAVQLSLYIHRNPLRAGLVRRLADYKWSSYPVYAYGRKGPPWLRTDLILSHFKGKDPRKAYREKVQAYADEEKRLWESLRHGMILGSEKFVEDIRGRFADVPVNREKPEQKNVLGKLDPAKILALASKVFHWDPGCLEGSRRLYGVDRENRDLVVYFLWRNGAYRNAEIGRIFGMGYSSVSHIARRMKEEITKNPSAAAKYEKLEEQFKM
uniref:Transposase IS200-like domain-containing protein n=1 Tax=Desulfacinum infernum TaxID=35837 RepID=A0A832EJZ6_9BACT